MPITIGTVDLELKLLPLTLNDDDSASITIRKGYTQEGNFVCISSQVISIPRADVAALLDSAPMEGLTRRNDLSLAIYQYLVGVGAVEAGTIS